MVNFCFKSCTFCIYYILYIHVWIQILFPLQTSWIHKAYEYGSGSTTLLIKLFHRLTSMERPKDGPTERKNFGCDQPDRIRDRLDHSRDRPRDRLDRSKDRPPERGAKDQPDRARERRDLSRDLR